MQNPALQRVCTATKWRVSILATGSEPELAHDLDDAATFVHRRDLRVVTRADTQIGIGEGRMVDEVRCIRGEIETHPLKYRKRLVNRAIDHMKPRSIDAVSVQVAEGSRSGGLERIRVEPLLDCSALTGRLRVSHLVREPFEVAGPRVLKGICGTRHNRCEGMPALTDESKRHGPAANRFI